MLATSVVCLILALVPFGFFWINLRMFRRADPVDPSKRPSVSVLIPARDEATVIEGTVQSVLRSECVDLEVIVLDDGSTDATPRILKELSADDPRLRIVSGEALPAGWCGKQFACWQLSQVARHELLLFLDADVRVERQAIARAVATKTRMGVGLLSGFPRQITRTWGEQLLLPLIHFVLLCYLPFWSMRRTTKQSSAAGCGQFFLTDRIAYAACGGHREIRESLHDGLKLTRLYRSHGMRTDVFDASDVAHVRMYSGLAETWNGLAKNAIEGVAHPRLIGVITIMLAGAHVIPLFLAAVLSLTRSGTPLTWSIVLSTLALSWTPRFVVASNFNSNAQRREVGWSGVVFHSVSIVLFLAIQWTALFRHLRGHESNWRGRSYTIKFPQPAKSAEKPRVAA